MKMIAQLEGHRELVIMFLKNVCNNFLNYSTINYTLM